MEINWLQLIINGFQLGAIYALVALGLTLIFSIMNVINFAHGEIYILGGFAGYYIFYQAFLEYFHLPIYAAFIFTFFITAIFLGLLGFVLEKAIFRPFRGDLLTGFLISIGLAKILQMGSAISFGPDPKGVPAPFRGAISILGASISSQRIAIIIIGAFIMIGLYLFLGKTKSGLAMMAITQDKEAAQSLGMNYGFVSSFGFAVSCALAGLAGFLIVPASYVDPFVGSNFLIKAFIIIIIGGMGSLTGCILGGFIIGFIESFGSYFINLPTSTIVSFMIVITFLIFRPRGLLGRAED
jgi:branched-chain amino acid transport system permease protein